MTMFLALFSIALYLAAAVLIGMRLASSNVPSEWLRNGSAGSVGLALCLHGALLYQGVVTDAGLNLGVFNSASLVAWVIVLVALGVAMMRPLESLGIFVLPLAAFTIALNLLYPGQRLVSDEIGLGVETHIVISILAYSVLSIAAFQSLVLAYQERRLRQKKMGAIMTILPPMQVQESVLFQMIGTGFFLLSLSLVSGMMFVADMFAQHLVHKTILAIFAWLVFGILLWGRWQSGWRGRTAIGWSLGGFVLLMLAYFGSKLVLELFLERAWHLA